jgi:hypothetical protein
MVMLAAAPQAMVFLSPCGSQKMTEVEVPKLEIAREYLDAAIEFYLVGTNLICAIHLAGAAEELLGKQLPKECPDHPEKERILTSAWKAERALVAETGRILSEKEARDRIIAVKNQIKDMANDEDTTVTFEFGPLAESAFQISHALTNFYKLGLPETPAIRKFEDHRCRKLHGLMGTARSSG